MELDEVSNTVHSNWKELNLGDSAVLKARIGWQGLTTAEYLDTGNYCLITGTDFKNGFIDWDNCVFVEKNRYDQDRKIQVKVGDVLVTKDGTIGKVAYVDKVPKPTTLNSGVFVVRPKNKAFNTKYFYYVLMSDHFAEFLSRLTAGSTISHLYQKDFVNYTFPLPPLPEQKTIAQVLSDTDNLIQAIEKKLSKKRAIKQGVMQQLLTPKEDWVVKKLGDIFSLKQGIQCGVEKQSRELKEGLVRFIRIIDITQDGEPPRFIENPGSAYKISENDLFMVRYGNPGLLGFGYSGVIANNLFSLKPKFKINELFFFHLLSFLNHKILELSSSTTMAALNFTSLKGLLIEFPNLIEQQNEISTILSDMDAEIVQLEQKLFKYKMVKEGLMQNLLTGKIRLV